MDFLNVLKMHILKYPKMQPADLVKLAYQSAFGPGHLIKDVARAEYYFFSELEAVNGEGDELYTEIGGGFVRVSLFALKQSPSLAKAVFSMMPSFSKPSMTVGQSER